MRRKIIPITMIITIIVIAIVSGLVFVVGKIFESNMPSSVKISLSDYYELPKGEAKLIVDTKESEINALVKDGKAYIPFSIAEEMLPKLYYDVFDDIIIYTTATEKYVYKANETKYTVNDKEDSEETPSFIDESGNIFVSVDFIKTRHTIEVKFLSDPYRLVIFENDKKEYKICTLSEDVNVRTGNDKKKPILKELKRDDIIYILGNSNEGEFVKILTDDGIIGYVDISKLATESIKNKVFTFDRNRENEEYTSIKREGPVVMGWHQVTSKLANKSLGAILSKVEELNVLSPTWFEVKDSSGEITDFASHDYVEKLHKLNIDVWGLLSDFNKSVDYKLLLGSNENRTNLINNIMYFIKEYDLDGINIDFENVKASYAKSYIQFLRELSIKMREEQKVLSIDNYIPLEFNAHYAIKEQGILADYICVMAYDEHYSGSKEAGSVSSLDWVEKSISKTTEKVQSDKVIVGLPFYTRIWRENSNGGLKSEAMGMTKAKQLVKQNNVKSKWNDKLGQYYAEWQDKNDRMRVWLEESRSITAKLKKVNRKKLAGVAFWKLGLEEKEAWNSVINWVK